MQNGQILELVQQIASHWQKPILVRGHHWIVFKNALASGICYRYNGMTMIIIAIVNTCGDVGKPIKVSVRDVAESMDMSSNTMGGLFQPTLLTPLGVAVKSDYARSEPLVWTTVFLTRTFHPFSGRGCPFLSAARSV